MVEPIIIDADEAIGFCDMNYDFELIGYQAGRRNPSNEKKSPGQLELEAKEYLLVQLDKL